MPTYTGLRTGPYARHGEEVYTRSSKVLLTWAVALFATLVVFNNLTDYDSNYAFVSHVLMMDTTFAGNRAMWRAIDTPFLYHAVYWIIILVEVDCGRLTGESELIT